MKDLFVLTADSDAQAIIRTVLQRNKPLDIRPISFDVQRYAGRDSGMVKDGPEIAREMVKKSEYSRLILIWDHHGSGWEGRSSEKATEAIQQRLDGVSWIGNSAAVVLAPELEEWLWHCPDALARHLGLSKAALEREGVNLAPKFGKTFHRCCREVPKELFEAIFYQRERRKPLPRDFEMLAATADLSSWGASASFARFSQILREWFPRQATKRS